MSTHKSQPVRACRGDDTQADNGSHSHEPNSEPVDVPNTMQDPSREPYCSQENEEFLTGLQQAFALPSVPASSGQPEPPEDVQIAQPNNLAALDAQDQLKAAHLILQLLQCHPNPASVAASVVDQEFHVVFIQSLSQGAWISAAETAHNGCLKRDRTHKASARDTGDQCRQANSMQQTSLRILNILTRQTSLQRRLLADRILETLLAALLSFLHSYPGDGTACLVVNTISLLLLAGMYQIKEA